MLQVAKFESGSNAGSLMSLFVCNLLQTLATKVITILQHTIKVST